MATNRGNDDKGSDESDKRNPFGGAAFDSDFAKTVKDSAQQIWLAGLGAFSKAQAEGGKVFESLVKDGINLQKKTQTAAEEKMTEAGSKWAEMAADVQAKASEHWGKFESVFEERAAKALNKFGAPSAKDFAALVAKVDALTEKVDRLSGHSAPGTRNTAPRKPAPRKTAGTGAAAPAKKKTSLKKTPARKTTEG